nr:2-succinyl-6-hydroxy-2,4-cyclohexadiene-1-carboxylate synthase [Bacilli bacterium]
MRNDVVVTTRTYLLRHQLYRVHSAGHRTSTPILFLHGFLGEGEDFKPLLKRLAKNHYVLAVDFLGHGRSAIPANVRRMTMAQTLCDLHALLMHLSLPKVHLCGYSMGGRIALAFALRYPQHVVSLVLESASPGLATAEERDLRIEQDRRLAERLLNDGMQKFVATWETTPLFASQKKLLQCVWERQRRTRLRQRARGVAMSLLGIGTGAQPSYWERLITLNRPTLIMTGELDGKFSSIAHKMLEKNSKFQACTFAHTGHNIHIEQIERYASVIRDFVDSHK